MMRRMLVLMFLVWTSVIMGSDCATASSSKRETAAVVLPLLEPDDEDKRDSAVILRARGARAVDDALRLSSTRTHTDRLLCGVKVA
jgi:hypothetical protein